MPARGIPGTVNSLVGPLLLAKGWENSRSAVTRIGPSHYLPFNPQAHLSKDGILHIAESASPADLTK